MLFGIVTAVLSGVVNAIGYTIQKKALDRVGTGYLKSPMWWLGIVLLIGAETLSGVAMVLMPVSVVVALNSLSVLFSSIFASFNEPCRPGLVASTLCIVVGSVLFGLTVTDNEVSYKVFESILSTQSIVYHVSAFVICVLIHMFRRTQLVYWAAYAGIVSSVTAMWYRPLVALFMDQRFSLFLESPLPYISILLLITTAPYAAGYLEATGLRLYPLLRTGCLLENDRCGNFLLRRHLWMMSWRAWFHRSLVCLQKASPDQPPDQTKFQEHRRYRPNFW